MKLAAASTGLEDIISVEKISSMLEHLGLTCHLYKDSLDSCIICFETIQSIQNSDEATAELNKIVDKIKQYDASTENIIT